MRSLKIAIATVVALAAAFAPLAQATPGPVPDGHTRPGTYSFEVGAGCGQLRPETAELWESNKS